MSASHFFLVLVLVALASAQHLFPSSVAFVNAPAQVALTSPAFQLTLNGTVQYVPGADGYDDRVHLSAVYQGSQIDIYANASFSAAQAVVKGVASGMGQCAAFQSGDDGSSVSCEKWADKGAGRFTQDCKVVAQGQSSTLSNMATVHNGQLVQYVTKATVMGQSAALSIRFDESSVKPGNSDFDAPSCSKSAAHH